MPENTDIEYFYSEDNNDFKYRVWHIPQVPGTPFFVYTNDVYEAFRISHALAMYDLFQFANNIKPDYSNASGVETLYEDGDWISFDEDELDEIDS